MNSVGGFSYRAQFRVRFRREFGCGRCMISGIALKSGRFPIIILNSSARFFSTYGFGGQHARDFGSGSCLISEMDLESEQFPVIILNSDAFCCINAQFRREHGCGRYMILGVDPKSEKSPITILNSVASFSCADGSRIHVARDSGSGSCTKSDMGLKSGRLSVPILNLEVVDVRYRKSL